MPWWGWVAIGVGAFFVVGNVGCALTMIEGPDARAKLRNWWDGMKMENDPGAAMIVLGPVLWWLYPILWLADRVTGGSTVRPGEPELDELADELIRVGARGGSAEALNRSVQCWVLRHRKRGVTAELASSAHTEPIWKGSVEDALAITRQLPRDAGLGRFWAAFRPDLPDFQLHSELDRLGVSEQKALDAQSNACVYCFHVLEEPGKIRLTGGWPVKQWVGTPEAATQQLKPLSPPAPLEAFWQAFPDATPGGTDSL